MSKESAGDFRTSVLFTVVPKFTAGGSSVLTPDAVGRLVNIWEREAATAEAAGKHELAVTLREEAGHFIRTCLSNLTPTQQTDWLSEQEVAPSPNATDPSANDNPPALGYSPLRVSID